jgi:hypothetical protein
MRADYQRRDGLVARIDSLHAGRSILLFPSNQLNAIAYTLQWHDHAAILWNRIVSGVVEPRVCDNRFRRSMGQPLGE